MGEQYACKVSKVYCKRGDGKAERGKSSHSNTSQADWSEEILHIEAEDLNIDSLKIVYAGVSFGMLLYTSKCTCTPVWKPLLFRMC